MPRHVAGSDQRRDRGEKKLRHAPPRGFAGDDDAGGGAQFFTQRSERGSGKLVEDEVADNHGIRGVIGKGLKIGRMPRARRGPGGGARTKIEAVRRETAPVQEEAEFARTRAEFQHALAGPRERRQHAREPAETAEHAIGQVQVAAVVQRGGMIGGEIVEEFGLEHAAHGAAKVDSRARSVERNGREVAAGMATLPRMKTFPTREWAVRAALVLAGAAVGWLGKGAGDSGTATPRQAALALDPQGEAAAPEAKLSSADTAPGGTARDALAARFGTAMLQSSPFKRQADFVHALETLKPEDADGLIALFDRLDRQGLHFPAEWQAFYQQWGAVDPERALAHALKEPDTDWAPGAMKDALRGWAARDPAAAGAWLRAHESAENFEPAFLGYVEGYADKDLAAATRMAMESVPPGNATFWKVGETLAEAAVRQGQLHGMEAWYDALPDQGDGTLKRAAFGHVWWRERHAGDQQAMDWLAGQAANPWRGDQQYGEMADLVAQRDPTAALGWLEKLPPSPNDGKWPGLGRVLRRWQQADPQGLQTWLQDPQADAFRDAARASYQQMMTPKARPAAQ